MSVTAVLQVAAGEKGNPTPSLLFSSLLFLGRSTAASTTGDGALGTLACACVGAGILDRVPGGCGGGANHDNNQSQPNA